MKGHNQRGNGNDFTFKFLHFVQFVYDTLTLIKLFKSFYPKRVQMKK